MKCCMAPFLPHTALNIPLTPTFDWSPTSTRSKELLEVKQASLKECVQLRKALAVERNERERDRAELTSMAITMRESESKSS